MTKKHIKITITVLLSFIVAFEIGYIVRMNILGRPTEEPIVTMTPEPIPVVGKSTDEPQAEEADGEPLPSQTDGADATEKRADDNAAVPVSSKVIVLDPGHGKSSSLMTSDEKAQSGWVKNSSGTWGEWRHYKKGSSSANCEGTGCNGRVTPNGACWYPMGNGDRNTEPDINLKNALAAKKYLEQKGYTVRMTRTSNNENPSFTKRMSYCYPGNDPMSAPDAAAYICIHSNASGGNAKGTAYITAKGPYDQAWIPADYEAASNRLGKLCNDKIVSTTSLSMHGSGSIDWEPELIAFFKSPVPCGYLEIGFFDNSTDLAILNSESDAIGKAIAEGVDEFCKTR